MSERIEFEEVAVTDPITRRKSDAVAVTRDGRQVALLPEAARLRRALALSLQEVEDIVNNFSVIVGREPTADEREFWTAVRDYKRSQREGDG
jgi:phosphoribosylformylglycinamidine (FGAM) synthase-like enzyme